MAAFFFGFLLLGVSNQDHVSVSMTLDEGQSAAVKRPVKVVDVFCLEVRDLLSR